MFIIFCSEQFCLKLVSHHALIFWYGRFAETEKEREINLKAAPCLFYRPPGSSVFRGEEGLSAAVTPHTYSFLGLYPPLLRVFSLCWANTSSAETHPGEETCGLCLAHTSASRAGCGFHRCLPARLSRRREQPWTSPRSQPLSPPSPFSARQVRRGAAATFSVEFWRIT